VTTASRWNFGDIIALRGSWRGKLWWACPARVVEDRPDLIAVYWAAGTPNKLPAARLSPERILTADRVDLVDCEWTGTDVLMLAIPGAAHSVYAMWDEGHARIRCWYVNLQESLRRVPTGFDSQDHLLDVVVSPDRTEWRWKDEAELEEALEVGLYSPSEAAAIREEGRRAIRLLQAEDSWVEDRWKTWSPPEEWGIPTLPDGWDRPA